eukprot:5359979-Pyramimonas_sp.AAC.1
MIARHHKGGSDGGLPSSAPEDSAKKEQIEKSKSAIQALRKVHSGWDRARREFNAVLAQSATCQNSQGSKIEADVRALIVEANDMDDMAVL